MAGLLSDVLPAVYSASNVMKNKLRGLLDDPLGTLQQVVGDANDRARNFNQLGDRSAAETMASVKAGKGLGSGPASNALLGKIADAYNPVAMTVWHGSPHQFSKFDASKIGTGEGAQAYGHGLYLAESPETAGFYREKLTSSGSILSRGDALEARSRVLRKVADRVEQTDPTRAAKLRADADTFTRDGALYKVDLPDDQIAKMLDWDKPLSQQAPGVQKHFEPMVAPIRADMARPANPGWGDLAAPTNFDPTGQELLGLLRNRDANLTAQQFLGNGLDSDVSSMLRQQGIPGIRYLDGGSRGAGAGSSNFVVFPGNEDMLTILERNGQPVNALRGLLER